MNWIIYFLIGLATMGSFRAPAFANSKRAKDLITPAMTDGMPAPGKRVRQVATEYNDTQVYHSLYLPLDWKQNKTYPVLVEYTGNKSPAVRSMEQTWAMA